MKPKSRWPDAHINLKRLYDERAPKDMTQKEFGSHYGIGSQGMVWQYLAGHRPLNYEAAAKFAKALRCTIYDISPEMADSLKEEILPVLGRALRRAAVLAFLAIVPLSVPAPADAASLRSTPPPTVYYVNWRKLLRRWFLGFMTFMGIGVSAACANIDEHTSPPADWPNLQIFEHRVPHARMRDECVRWAGFLSPPEACAVVNFELLRCDIWLSADFPPQPWILEHEKMHCAGHDHIGESGLATAWKDYKSTIAGKAVAESVRKRTPVSK